MFIIFDNNNRAAKSVSTPFSLTGTPPSAVVGSVYSFSFTPVGGTGLETTEIDAPALALLTAHNITYNGTTHTLSSDGVT